MGETQACKLCGMENSHSICSNCFISLFSNTPDRVSFSFETKLPVFSKLKHVKVLDLFRTSVATINMNDFPELIMLRVSHCHNLSKVSLTDIPLLKVLDLSANKELISFEADSCVSKIVALDLSYCENLTSMPINDIYESLQYISIRHTRISELAKFPEARYLDISSTNISDLSRIDNMKLLEILVLDHMPNIDEADMSSFSFLPKLKTIQSDIKNITFKKWNSDSPLSQIWLQHSKNVIGLQELLKKKDEEGNISYSAYLPNNVLLGNKFRSRISVDVRDTWHNSARLLYGPWPIPPCYQKPLRRINSPCPIPERYNKLTVVKCISGAIFGSSVIDSVMLFVERQIPESLNFFLEGQLDITWSHPRVTRRGIDYYRGGITDNTAVLMLTIRSLVSKESRQLCVDLAKKLKEFFTEGLPEFQLRFPATSHAPSVSKIIRDKEFTSDPTSAAKKYWQSVGETPNGNDALTRSIAIGCFNFWDEQKVADNAQKLCRITHYDPRCAFSSVCLALTISRFIRWRCGEIDSVDIEKLIDDSVAYVKDLTPYMVAEIRKFTVVDDLQKLNLKSFSPLALQAIGCAFWSLKMNLSYVQAIETIIGAGGDAATNSVIVGAVIGAKNGLGGIPIDLMEFFWKGSGVYRDLVALFKAMNIDFQMPKYDEYFTMKFD